MLTAKVFENGRSQAIRIPKEYRFIKDLTPKSLTDTTEPIEDFLAPPKSVDDAKLTAAVEVQDYASIYKIEKFPYSFEECLKIDIDPTSAVNWVTVNILGELNKDNSSIKDFYITPKLLKQIIDAIKDGKISSKQAKEVFAKSLEEKKEPKNYIGENSQISDENTLRDLITTIISNNQEQKQAYLNGKTNLFDYFVGQVMKETKGKANPNITKEILNELLNK